MIKNYCFVINFILIPAFVLFFLNKSVGKKENERKKKYLVRKIWDYILMKKCDN